MRSHARDRLVATWASLSALLFLLPLSADIGGVGLARMHYRSNFVVLVGGGSHPFASPLKGGVLALPLAVNQNDLETSGHLGRFKETGQV